MPKAQRGGERRGCRARRSARAFDHASAIAGAELAGVMDRALEMSLDYLKTRVQFGKPIGSLPGAAAPRGGPPHP